MTPFYKKVFLWAILPLCLIICSLQNVNAQSPSLDVGLRFQKTLDLYFENGLTVQYTNPKLLKNHLQLGIGYVTSRLGSAIASNAIKQDNAFLSGSYFFRPARIVRPVLTSNAGWFQADYGSEIFDDLPRSSPILSLEAGLSVSTHLPVKIGAAIGYNFITGSGGKGPGTLYPVYAQVNVTFNVLKNKSK